MTRREILGRYKGSIIGLIWSFLNPVLMLGVYTFVFSYVFNARWGGVSESRIEFALMVFAGLIVHSFFSDILNRAPSLILSNVNYVKKVVFPLEILPIVTLCTAGFHFLVSASVLLVAFILHAGYVHWTVFYLPIVLLPMTALALGVGWVLASLGVYLRDIGQITGLFTNVLLFLSPVFYPVGALPNFLQSWMLLNPLTLIIEQIRLVLIVGQAPEWDRLLIYTGVVSIVIFVGFIWFQKTRRGFADVV
jgi:lipopolysaccharide transport system permease protein